MRFCKFFSVRATMVLAAFVLLNPRLEAQNQTVYGSVNGTIGYNFNNAAKPVAIPAGNGVVAAGAWVTATGNQFKDGTPKTPKGEAARVYAVSGVQAPNAAETQAMDSVVSAAIDLGAAQRKDLPAARLKLATTISQNIKTINPPNGVIGQAPQFLLNPKRGLNAAAEVDDPKNLPYAYAQGTGLLSKNLNGVQLVTQVLFNPDAMKLAPGSTKTAFVVYNDPIAVDWGTGSSTHTVTVDLSQLMLKVGTDSDSAVADAAGLRGSFFNGTTDLTTPESSATSLFSLSMAVAGAGGTAPYTSLDLQADPSDSISDTMGATTLAGVTSDLLAQFNTPQTDPSTGETYYGFNTGYEITWQVPGTDPNSVLFLDQFGVGTISSVPEPSGLVQVIAALLFGGGIFVRRCRKACVRRSLIPGKA